MDTSRPESRWRRRLALGLTLALLVVAAFVLDLRAVGEHLRAMTLGPLLAALFLSTVDRFVMAEKWRQLLRTGERTVRLGPVLAAYYQSSFASYVVPSAIGAEVIRAFHATRLGISMRIAIASMTIERAMGAVGGAMLGAAAAWYLDLVAALWITAGLLTILVGSALIARHPRVRPLLLWSHRTLAVNLALAILEHLIQAVTIVAIALALRINVDGLQFAAVVTLVLLVRRTIGYFQSWGLAEGATVVLYERAGLGLEPAAALALATYAVGFIASLPGAVAFLGNASPLWRSQRPGSARI